MPWNMQVKDTNQSHSREKPVWISLWRRIWNQLEAWILTSQGLPCLPAFDKSPEAARKLGQELHAGLLQMVPKLCQALLSCPRLSGSLVPHSGCSILEVLSTWYGLPFLVSCFYFSTLSTPLIFVFLPVLPSPGWLPAVCRCCCRLEGSQVNRIDCLMLKK